MELDPVIARLPEPSPRRLAVRVTKDALRQIRSGHPWVFDSSVTSVSHEGAPGDLAVIFDDRRRFAAVGLYDPSSPLRVRVLHHGEPSQNDEDFWRRRLDDAFTLRSPLEGSAQTTGYRVLHGENDGFPGLVLDRYDTTLVLKLYSSAWLAHLRTVLAVLDERLAPVRVVLRLSRDVQRQPGPEVHDGMTLAGPPPDGPVPFLENGLTMEADVLHGQKTGHFLDQRENRQLVRALTAEARVLDVFSCTGGFTVHAAAGGAASVHSVDQSEAALRLTERNLANNRDLPAVRALQHRSTAGDAFEVLERLADRGERYDVVILDPPSFASRQQAVERALRAYGRLTDLGVSVLEPGGLLVQASCSSRVAASDFFAVVRRRATAAGVGLEEVARTGHPLDHPIGFAQGAYLKALFARAI